MCPDYDVCEACHSIVPEQHPKHPFVRIHDPKDILIRPHHYANRVLHHARCDSCSKQISGARFKCLHPDCPDYDLCENCEALPIDVHPSSHPLIKLKQPISSYQGLQRVFEFTHGSKSAGVIVPIHATREPTVIRHVMDAAAATSPALSGPVEEPLPEMAEKPKPVVDLMSANDQPASLAAFPAMRSPMNPWWAEEDIVALTQEAKEPVVLEAEGEMEKTVVTPVRTPEAPKGVAPVEQEELAELTSHMKIEEPVPGSPSTMKSDSRPASPSPFADENAVDATKDDVISLASPAESVPALESSVSSATTRPSASFVADNNIPDGHVLPAGSFFVKSWKLINDGSVEWPAGTQLLFAGGDRMGTSETDELIAGNGAKPGEVVDIQVELRAPAVAGRYASYWRLKDNEGRPFGHRIWCDVIVVEAENAGSNSSLSSSTVIMPAAGAALTAAAVAEVAGETAAAPSSPTVSTLPSDVDALSQVSDTSDLWEVPSRAGSPDQFVMVYDSEEDDI